MKYLIFALLAITSTACATPEFMGGTHGYSDEEMQAKNEQFRQINEENQKAAQKAAIENEAKQKAHDDALKEGATLEQFQAALGKPNRTELLNGVLYAHYSYGNDFTVYGFKDGKLIGWTQDLGAKTDYQIAEIRSDQEAARIRASQQQSESDRKARIRRIFAGFGKSKTCDTHQYSNGDISTTCN